VTTTDSGTWQRRTAKGGKHLGFCLGDELFAIDVYVVREIIERQRITRVPRTAHHVLGLINLRGKVIPVVDLRRKLGLPDNHDDDRARIIVVEVQGVRTGVLVDGVTEVLDITAEEVEVPPHMGEGADMAYLLGLAKIKDAVFLLMDLEGVLATDDVIELSRLSGLTLE